MKNKSLSEKVFPAGLFTLATVMLFNPNINILDLLPDFIGYLIIAHLLIDPSRRVPFFAEARSGFLKLALLSFAKYPAFVMMIMIRSRNTADNDIIPLLSFSFAIAEILLSVNAVKNLFAGISYLGERTGSPAVIGVDPSADKLRTLTLVFAVSKCLLYTLPELLLLSVTTDAGTPSSMMSAARFYPFLLLTAQLVGYAFGFAWMAFFRRYLKTLKTSGEFYPAVMQLSDSENELKIAWQIKKDKALVGLKLLPLAALFTLELSLDIFNDVNILPHFISGVLFLTAISKLTVKKSRLKTAFIISGIVYNVTALLTWLFGIDYYDSFTRTEIALYDDSDRLFVIYTALSAIEAVLFLVFFALSIVLLADFVRTHTGKTPPNVHDPLALKESGNNYTRLDKRYHRSFLPKIGIFVLFGIVSTAAKFIHVFTDNDRVLNSSSRIPAEYIRDVVPSLIPSVAPWLGTAIAIIAVVWSIYTLWLTGILAEDFKIKYSDSTVIHEETESQYF